mmetsp:Transcript_10155/g.13209  ORF Transcript_10155/g.13209 Transcript_10155/m.13209 type:complete len:282 (-) Transcript_10155:36-881(-)
MNMFRVNKSGNKAKSRDEEEAFEDCLSRVESTDVSQSGTIDMRHDNKAAKQILAEVKNKIIGDNELLQSSIVSELIYDESSDYDDDSSNRDLAGVIITFGREQFLSPPALLLLCPITSIFVIFAFLDLEGWRWRACLEDRSMRRHCYGYQAFAFSFLLLIGMQFYGDRIVEESFGGGQQTTASRLYQRQLAVLILACGIGLIAIEDTLAKETSIFATSFGCFLIFSGALHKASGLPFVTWIAFIWNGVQIVFIAWYGGNKVDGKWTEAWGWTGDDSTGIAR